MVRYNYERVFVKGTEGKWGSGSLSPEKILEVTPSGTSESTLL